MWDRLGHRRSPRYQVALPCRYTPQGPAPAQAGSGRTCSLSDSGACLELAEPFPPSTRLHLTLEAATGRLGLDAEVVWVGAPGRPGGGLLHGVHFLPVTPAQESTLRTLLRPPTGGDVPRALDAPDLPRDTAGIVSPVQVS